MEENYEALLRYYGAHAKGHSRDPFGPNAANAKSAIRATLENYQCNIPALQNSLEQKYRARPALTNDKYKCGQGGGRRRRRSRKAAEAAEAAEAAGAAEAAKAAGAEAVKAAKAAKAVGAGVIR